MMAKEKDVSKEEKKREKREKKEKRSEKDGVHKSTKDSKDKREKREKKILAAATQEPNVTTSLLNALEDDEKPVLGSPDTKENDGDAMVVKLKNGGLLGASVPFANPLADEKVGKKVLKSVKKAAKNKSLKRGVKEVVKSLRKSSTGPNTTTSSAGNPIPIGIVVLAADISPMDVISHIPVLCEDHNVPYIFVPSRAELGAAGSTKRPTSVVMVSPERGGRKGKDGKDGKDGNVEDGEEDFVDVYRDLVRVIEKASRDVKI